MDSGIDGYEISYEYLLFPVVGFHIGTDILQILYLPQEIDGIIPAILYQNPTLKTSSNTLTMSHYKICSRFYFNIETNDGQPEQNKFVNKIEKIILIRVSI